MTLNYNGVFVTGTDTGVGKTVVSACIALSIARWGESVGVLKPVQTGAGFVGVLDVEFVYRALGEGFDLEEVCPYRFSEPLSPMLAASLAGEEIEIPRVVRAYQRLRAEYDFVVVEGAGGLLVPIKEGYLMSDLARELALPVVVVARPGLGTINHTLLTVHSARSMGLEVLGIVINNYPSNPTRAERTNPAALDALCDAPIIGVVPSVGGVSVGEGMLGGINPIGEVAERSLGAELGGRFSIGEFLKALEG